VAFDTLNIFLKENPVVNMGPDKRICWYDSFLVVPTAKNAFWIDPVTSDTMQQGDTLLWQWQYTVLIIQQQQPRKLQGEVCIR
jgi:hypothetical protein